MFSAALFVNAITSEVLNDETRWLSYFCDKHQLLTDGLAKATALPPCYRGRYNFLVRHLGAPRLLQSGATASLSYATVT